MASATPGVPVSDAETLRMRQILASNVAPHCRVGIYGVARPSGDGFYVVEVPRSADAPHAVRKGEDLRYPRRDGTSKRWLAESEVADAYRSRFEGLRAHGRQHDRNLSEGLADLRSNGDPDTAWLVVALTPDQSGALVLDHGSPGRVGQELRQRPHPLSHGHSASLQQRSSSETIGFRRVVVTQEPHYESGGFRGGRWHFHTDGAGFAAVAIGWRRLTHDGRQVADPPTFEVNDEDLVVEFVQTLAALIDHAVSRCGAGPLGLVTARVEAHGEPVHLMHPRGGFRRDRDGPGTVNLPGSEHTIDLAAAQASPIELLAASRLILNDIAQGFGRAECWQIDPDGRMRMPYFSREMQQRIVAPWAESAGVPMSDETVT